MTPCLGSVGAARVLGAARTRRCYGLADGKPRMYASWLIGDLYLTCTPSLPRRFRWACLGRYVSRDTARLLLTGLLTPQMVAEFAEDVRLIGGGAMALSIDEHDWAAGYAQACTDILDKLREMGVVK